jgi:hypothetical protein
MTPSAESDGPVLRRIPLVIAPDIILDLIGTGSGGYGRDAELLFERIAADLESGNEERPACIAPNTVSVIHHHALRSGPTGKGTARMVIQDVLRLCGVVHLTNADYAEALEFRDYEFEDALQFVTCRRIDAEYLVTRRQYDGVRRAPVRRRTAAEMLPMFRGRHG